MYVDLQKCSRFGINMCRSKHSGGEMQNNCSFKFCHVYKDHPSIQCISWGFVDYVLYKFTFHLLIGVHREVVSSAHSCSPTTLGERPH